MKTNTYRTKVLQVAIEASNAALEAYALSSSMLYQCGNDQVDQDFAACVEAFEAQREALEFYRSQR